MEYNKNIGSCGLACVLCSAMQKGECEGCLETKASNCEIKKCCIDRTIQGCYECDEFPCEKDMFKNNRVCGFIKCVKEMGVEGLVSNLLKNDKVGIRYHPENGSRGDYDVLSSEAEVIKLVKHGR